MRKKTSIKTQLDELELNSWNLELIISGLVLFLLFGVSDQIENLLEYAIYMFQGNLKSRLGVLLFFGTLTLYSVWFSTILNLILHLFLRGFWMALIGLRYVSADIDIVALKYNQQFSDELSKMSHYDDYIEKIEKICSVIYSITFLIFFFALSFFAYLLFSLFMDTLICLLPIENEGYLHNLMSFFIALPWLIVFIDFLGLGWIKKIKKPRFIAYIYRPIYKLINVLSLSFLYRHIFYNLMDNKYGKRVVLLLFVYLCGLFLYSTTCLNTHRYQLSKKSSRSLLEQGKFASTRYYDDLRTARIVEDFSVPSMYIKEKKLKIFFSYLPHHDALVQRNCPDLEIEKTSNIRLVNRLFNNSNEENIDFNAFLDCFKNTISIQIGEKQFDSLKFYFQYKTDPIQPGFITYIDISDTPQDEFLLEIEMQNFNVHLDTMIYKKVLLPMLKE